MKKNLKDREDVSQYVLREYQKLSGEFVPENVQKICGYYDAEQTNDRLVRSILRQKKKIICMTYVTFWKSIRNCRKRMRMRYILLYVLRRSGEL